MLITAHELNNGSIWQVMADEYMAVLADLQRKIIHKNYNKVRSFDYRVNNVNDRVVKQIIKDLEAGGYGYELTGDVLHVSWEE